PVGARVVGDDVGRGDEACGLAGDQFGVSGADADSDEPPGRAWGTHSSSCARALIADEAIADPPRRPCTTRCAMPRGWSARACLDSAAPMKPTGTPTIAAGTGPPASIISSRWNSAVGALPIAT